jgi:hypothetical protein
VLEANIFIDMQVYSLSHEDIRSITILWCLVIESRLFILYVSRWKAIFYFQVNTFAA